MFKNCNGFTFTEALVAFTITLVICFTIAPLIHLINNERESLYDRRVISSHLHDTLQTYIYDKHHLPYDTLTTINKRETKLTFQLKNEHIKACASWENWLNRKETICLYGIPV